MFWRKQQKIMELEEELKKMRRKNLENKTFEVMYRQIQQNSYAEICKVLADKEKELNDMKNKYEGQPTRDGIWCMTCKHNLNNVICEKEVPCKEYLPNHFSNNSK